MNKKEEQRKKKIEVRVTEAERAAIEKNAGNYGLTVSAYARKNLVDGFIFVKTKQEENGISDDRTIDRKVLIGIANNLNQLTRFSHENQELHPKIESLIDQLKGYFNR